MALSDVEISQAKPKDKEYKLSDGGGLYLLVRAQRRQALEAQAPNQRPGAETLIRRVSADLAEGSAPQSR